MFGSSSSSSFFYDLWSFSSLLDRIDLFPHSLIEFSGFQSPFKILNFHCFFFKIIIFSDGVLESLNDSLFYNLGKSQNRNFFIFGESLFEWCFIMEELFLDILALAVTRGKKFELDLDKRVTNNQLKFPFPELTSSGRLDKRVTNNQLKFFLCLLI